MAGLQYVSYPGMGEAALQTFGYRQAVRVGDRIECSGQRTGIRRRRLYRHYREPVGLDVHTGEVPKDFTKEIDQIFANVDYSLKHAGGRGWPQVFRMTSYHTNMGSRDWDEPMISNFKKWVLYHQPI